MEIKRWFQGTSTCYGVRPTIRGGFGLGSIEPGTAAAHCLGSVIGWGPPQEMILMADTIDRLFPGRACTCSVSPSVQAALSCYGGSAAMRIIHFNNNPETTRE